MPQSNVLFELKNLTVSFQGRPALHHFSAHIQRGEMWSVLGPNGSGKTTLLRLLAGELNSWEGHFVNHVKDPRRIAYLGQTPLLNQDLPVRVYDVVSQGIAHDLPWGLWGRFWKRGGPAEERILKALRAMGLAELKDEVWSHLSGGQRQRALIARLFAQDADVLLLDEPTNSLDEASQNLLMTHLQAAHHAGKTIVCVMHDEPLAHSHFSKCLSLEPTDCPPELMATRLTGESL